MYIDNSRMDSLSSLKSIKRHYKKDSRYVNDLYTLTYDNHESLDTVELISSLYFRTDITDDVSFNCFIGVSRLGHHYSLKIKLMLMQMISKYSMPNTTHLLSISFTLNLIATCCNIMGVN